MSAATTHFALLYHHAAPAGPTAVVRADTERLDDGVWRLFDDERLVYRVAEHWLVDIRACETHKEATELARAHREQLAGAGAASCHIREGAAAARAGRGARNQAPSGVIAEGFSVRVVEVS